jgi:hypothetical protein
MNKFLENFAEAEKLARKTDHLLSVTYPLVPEKKLLLQILKEQKEALMKGINAILQYEHLKRNLTLSQDPKINFENFQNKCATKYSINQQDLKEILELLITAKQHERSDFEFIRHDKVVIITKSQGLLMVSSERLKQFQALLLRVLRKTKQKLYENIKESQQEKV